MTLSLPTTSRLLVAVAAAAVLAAHAGAQPKADVNEATEKAMKAASAKVAPSIVKIETAGGTELIKEKEDPKKKGGAPQGTEQADKGKSAAYSMQGFGAQFCEVRVDPDLGIIRVARWVGSFALGKVLNAKTLRSQLQGGVVWGIGMALQEDALLDQRHARYVNSNLAEYHVPVNADVPDIDIIVVEEQDQLVSPLGAKGAGEIGITGAAAAICNAVYHATGKRVRDLPITLDKVI